MRRFGLLAASAIVYAAMTTPGSAALMNTGFISGNECGGQGGFQVCHADTAGTYNEPDANRNGSPVIYKRDAAGAQDFGNFASITGSEFTISFDTNNHELTWTYTPGLNDPEVHFFAIKQSNGYVLFYDTANPILSATVDLDPFFGQQAGGFSHVTWFDTGCTANCNPPPSVPEPASMALLGAGLLGLGLIRRRRSV